MMRQRKPWNRSRRLVESLEPRTLLTSTWMISFGNPGIVASTGIPTPFKNLAPAFTFSISFFSSSFSFFGAAGAKSSASAAPTVKPVSNAGATVKPGVSLNIGASPVVHGATNVLLPKLMNSGINFGTIGKLHA